MNPELEDDRGEGSRGSDIKLMADLLRGGATLTELHCPACSSPLFRLRSGELWCAKCRKPVVVVGEGEEIGRALGRFLLSSLENTLLEKVGQLSQRLKVEEDPQEIGRLSIILSRLLEALERVRRISRR